MRTNVGIVLLLCLGAPASAWAGDREKALAVIERAVKAHGGVDALTKTPIRVRSGQGVVGLSGDRPFTTEESVRFPDRCRMVLDVGRERLIVVLNGDKGWMQAGGTTQEMNKATFAERREELYVWWLMTLAPLLKDGFELKPQADAKVNDREAAVVKVSSKGYPDATLFFDKKTDLLVKIARRGTEAGIPVSKEYLYSDHKDFDGVKMPSKEITKINGTKLSEVKFTSYKFLSRIEDATFNKP
ncbi:MAG TPA: hypothetical protein VN688_27840 [Gemmataceae bacterium]|nr:hypothetical protein [Gemmataceae bacterium]